MHKEMIAFIGIVLVFAGISLLIFYSISGAQATKSETKFAFGGFIGPIPFGFASSPEMLKAIFFLSIIVLAAFIILARLFLR